MVSWLSEGGGRMRCLARLGWRKTTKSVRGIYKAEPRRIDKGNEKPVKSRIVASLGKATDVLRKVAQLGWRRISKSVRGIWKGSPMYKAGLKLPPCGAAVMIGVLGSLVMVFLICCILLLIQLISGPTAFSVTLHPRPTRYPDVTVCNINPIRRSSFKQYIKWVKEEFEKVAKNVTIERFVPPTPPAGVRIRGTQNDVFRPPDKSRPSPLVDAKTDCGEYNSVPALISSDAAYKVLLEFAQKYQERRMIGYGVLTGHVYDPGLKRIVPPINTIMGSYNYSQIRIDHAKYGGWTEREWKGVFGVTVMPTGTLQLTGELQGSLDGTYKWVDLGILVCVAGPRQQVGILQGISTPPDSAAAQFQKAMLMYEYVRKAILLDEVTLGMRMLPEMMTVIPPEKRAQFGMDPGKMLVRCNFNKRNCKESS